MRNELSIDSPLSECSQILTNLFLTGVSGVTQENITNNRIKFIVDVTVEPSEATFDGVEIFKLELPDTPEANIGQHFESVSEKIAEQHKNGKNVLVHCKAGCSRSATLVIAYVMKYKEFSLRDAYNFVKEKRSIIRPNPGFFQQLVDYEKKLYGTSTVKMVTLEGLDGYTIDIPDLYIED